MANGLGRLAQGVGKIRPANQRIPGINTIFFIKRRDVPPGRKVTYCKQEATIRPNKTEINRVRNCASGDRLDFPGPTATQTASLTTIKILLNSIISTPGTRFSPFDIKNFYYGTPMNRYEYMKLHISKIPAKIIKEYNLTSLATADGWIYMEIRKGMPGLKQAGRIANDRLTLHLAKFGYSPVPRTPSLWTYATRPIAFSLVVDDFGVKYVGERQTRSAPAWGPSSALHCHNGLGRHIVQRPHHPLELRCQICRRLHAILHPSYVAPVPACQTSQTPGSAPFLDHPELRSQGPIRHPGRRFPHLAQLRDHRYPTPSRHFALLCCRRQPPHVDGPRYHWILLEE
jgi:hypothetical protein